MSKYLLSKMFSLCIVVSMSFNGVSASEPQNSASLEQAVKGLWLYTGLITSKGKNMPLKGIFLFNKGMFVQYALFDGEPVSEQGAMAHAGPYHVEGEFVHLVAEQTLSTSPGDTPPMSSRGLTEHDVAVLRQDSDLTLTFSKGTGTVQTFTQAGPGVGEIYKLENGVLALVDGYILLVDGNDMGISAGYGTYQQSANGLNLDISRWTEASTTNTSNLKESRMQATFDGKTLTLENGRSFRVIP